MLIPCKTAVFLMVLRSIERELAEGSCLPCMDARMEEVRAWKKVALHIPQVSLITCVKQLDTHACKDTAPKMH
jgi:hypothetical protein